MKNAFQSGHWSAWQGTAHILLSDDSINKLRYFKTTDDCINWLFQNDQRDAARALNAHVKAETGTYKPARIALVKNRDYLTFADDTTPACDIYHMYAIVSPEYPPYVRRTTGGIMLYKSYSGAYAKSKQLNNR